MPNFSQAVYMEYNGLRYFGNFLEREPVGTKSLTKKPLFGLLRCWIAGR